MTIMDSLLINKTAPENFEELLKPYQNENEPFLFAVIGDLDLDAHYGQTAVVVGEKRFFILDADKNTVTPYSFSDITSAKIKRMYSNAYLTLTKNDGTEQIVMRFTFSVAGLMDMTSKYINAIAKGKDKDTEMEIVKNAYEKLVCVCPKCGRHLLHPGAPCIKCQSKGKIIKKFAPYVLPEKWHLLGCLAIILIMSAIQLLPPYTTKMIIDDIIPKGNLAMLGVLVLAMLLCYIIHYSLAALLSYILCKSGGRIVVHLRNDVYKKAQYLPMKFYDKTATGQVINRIGGDTSTIENFIINIVRDAVLQLILLVGIIVIMLAMNWRLTLISLIPVPLVVVGGKLFAKKVAPLYRRTWRKWAGVTSVLTDSIPCIRVVKAFSGEERAVSKFENYNDEWYKTVIKTGRVNSVFPNVLAFLITIGTLTIWAIGGNWAMHETFGLTPGILVSFISYTSMFYTPVRYFASIGNTYQSALSSVERVMDIIDAEPEYNKEGAEKVERVEGSIEFKNVNFSFDKTKKVLTDVNFKINAGDIVGVVGTTGSGKSTLINLLMRYYDSYEGEILVDGKNIKDIDIQCYRGHIGYVQQEPQMFSDTIYNNIAYGDPEAPPEAVMHAADVANAHGFILTQPDAYDSMLGERGVGLSGGEKQRISIARAILKNPSILIFDEATASVDSETEELIQEAIDRLISGRTTIMIAHRLSTLRKANRILVVDNGKIIENGTHDELMAKKGKYYKLIKIQSLNSRGSDVIFSD